MKKTWCLALLVFFTHRAHAQKQIPLLIIGPSEQVNFRGDILFLTGWNMVGSDAPNHTAFFYSASAVGYRIFIPEPGKSIYAGACFPETRADYRNRLLLTWFTDTLMPHLQTRFDAFKPGAKNILLGISTGARGAMLMAEALPATFSYAIGISGDYNPCLNPNDALIINHYGSYKDFPLRWQTLDNPTHNIGALRAKVFLYHGAQDRVVDAQQSIAFSEALQKQCAQESEPWCNQPFILHLQEKQGHDWQAWNQSLMHLLNHVLNVP
jgi:hypothetical protein